MPIWPFQTLHDSPLVLPACRNLPCAPHSPRHRLPEGAHPKPLTPRPDAASLTAARQAFIAEPLAHPSEAIPDCPCRSFPRATSATSLVGSRTGGPRRPLPNDPPLRFAVDDDRNLSSRSLADSSPLHTRTCCRWTCTRDRSGALAIRNPSGGTRRLLETSCGDSSRVPWPGQASTRLPRQDLHLVARSHCRLSLLLGAASVLQTMTATNAGRRFHTGHERLESGG